MPKYLNEKLARKLIFGGAIGAVTSTIFLLYNTFSVYDIVGRCEGNKCPDADNKLRSIQTNVRIGTILVYLFISLLMIGVVLLIYHTGASRSKNNQKH